MKGLFPILCVFFVFNGLLKAQDLPVSHVYTFDMKKLTDTTYNFSNPNFLTAFNPNGYNNQPQFIEDNLLYITVQFPESPQTDIYSLNLDNKELTQITKTVEGEYSPTLLPRSNYFTTVRVEADGQGTQRLWKYPLDRGSMGELAFKNITGVGYHHWLNEYKAVLFIVGQPSKLVLANSLTGSQVQLMESIGRGMQRLAGDNLAFIHKVNDQNWMLKEIDTYTYRAKDIIPTLPNSEDFILLEDDATFLMGNGSKLYRYNKYADKNWREIADFRHYGINNITRLALSPNGTIAIVNRLK
jgi:hypothetical protein